MPFNTFRFIFGFAPAVMLAFFALPRQRARVVLLAAASYVFYGFAGHLFPLLLASVTLWSYAGALLIARAPQERRKAALWLSIAGPLLALVVFKYAGFVANDTASVIETLTDRGLPSWHSFARGVILPVGISFYTFEAISYVVDVYRGRMEAERDLLRYACFMAYFPHLIAGPIVRYERLKPQLERRYSFDPGLFFSGLTLFGVGLAKKVLVADTLAGYVDSRYAAPGQLGLLDGWLVVLAFASQIYFDFGGYTDMAIGLSRMIGIDLPWNFDRPFSATSPSDFWNRWNVTLSRWLRDYLYVPLNRRPHGAARRGHKRKGLRREVTLLLTMGIAGLWHGASLNFLLWGLYMGALVIVTRRIGQITGVTLPRPLAIGLTYTGLLLGGVLFRVHDVASIPGVYAGLVGLHGLGSASLAVAVFTLLVNVYLFSTQEEWRWRPETWRFPRLAVATAGIGALAGLAFIWMLAPPHPFVYFQF